MDLIFRLAMLLVFVQSGSALAEGGHCRKCEVMNEYHKNNPSKFQYYDDYIKDLEEKGASKADPSAQDLPPDVKFIMDLESVGTEVTEKRKPG